MILIILEMVESTINSKTYRTVTVPTSASLLPNNLSASPDGSYFVTVKNTEKNSIINVYD